MNEGQIVEKVMKEFNLLRYDSSLIVKAIRMGIREERERILGEIDKIIPLSSGSNASSVVPCFDEYDNMVLKNVSFVTIKESDWKDLKSKLKGDV